MQKKKKRESEYKIVLKQEQQVCVRPPDEDKKS